MTTAILRPHGRGGGLGLGASRRRIIQAKSKSLKLPYKEVVRQPAARGVLIEMHKLKTIYVILFLL